MLYSIQVYPQDMKKASHKELVTLGALLAQLLKQPHTHQTYQHSGDEMPCQRKTSLAAALF